MLSGAIVLARRNGLRRPREAGIPPPFHAIRCAETG